jgi:hypothetical protein
MSLGQKISVLLLSSSLWLTSCYEQKEGCLDVLASNFQLDADIDCCRKNNDCCCNYPQLSLNLKHEIEGENLSRGQVYQTALGQPFFVVSIQFFISDIVLVEGEEEFGVDDFISLKTANEGEVSVSDDITAISSQSFSYTIGQFKRAGTYQALRFKVGVDEPEKSVDPDQFNADHPLHSNQSTLRDSLGNLLLYDIAWIPDTVSMEIVHLQCLADQILPVDLALTGSKAPGQSISIPLVIDYSQWLSNINIERDPEEVQMQKIIEGIARSFSIL